VGTADRTDGRRNGWCDQFIPKVKETFISGIGGILTLHRVVIAPSGPSQRHTERALWREIHHARPTASSFLWPGRRQPAGSPDSHVLANGLHPVVARARAILGPGSCHTREITSSGNPGGVTSTPGGHPHGRPPFSLVAIHPTPGVGHLPDVLTQHRVLGGVDLVRIPSIRTGIAYSRMVTRCIAGRSAYL
jgi:hypothetical protein